MSTTRKAIQLKVLLRVEGEQEAPDDFAALATRAIEDALKGVRMTVPRLRVIVKKVEEYSSDDEEDESEQAS